MNEIIDIINKVGFPIFVAIFLLIKDQKEKKLTREALIKLTEAINNLIKK